jgi:hypothetical protein
MGFVDPKDVGQFLLGLYAIAKPDHAHIRL